MANSDPADLTELTDVLARLPDGLADLRSPWPARSARMLELVQVLESTALRQVFSLVEHRNRAYPDPATWLGPSERYPQPDPTHLLAVREWVLSLGAQKTVPLSRQKRLGSSLTQILIAKAAIETYSKRLRHASAPDLVRTLAALWLLVAECWKLRPLLTGETSHE
jgi:hypothetical protein